MRIIYDYLVQVLLLGIMAALCFWIGANLIRQIVMDIAYRISTLM